MTEIRFHFSLPPPEQDSARAARSLPDRFVGAFDSDLGDESAIRELVAGIDALTDGGRPLKKSPVSDVSRVQWLSRDIVIKRYNHQGLIHSLRHTSKCSRARRSWVNAPILLACNIRTPHPLVYVERYRGALLWKSYIITEYVDGRNLDGILHDEADSPQQKSDAVDRVLDTLSSMATHRISHGDVKPSNILFWRDLPVFADLDAMKVHRSAWTCARRQQKDVDRFLAKVEAAGRHTEGAEDSHRQGHDRTTWLRRRFLKRQQGLSTLYIRNDLRNADFETALLAGEQALRERYVLESVTSAASSSVYTFMVAPAGVEREVYLKQYQDRSWLDVVKHLVRPDRAMRALRGSLALAEHGFGVPQTVAVGRTKTGIVGSLWHSYRCFLVTVALAGAKPLYHWLHAEAPYGNCVSLQRRRELIRALGRVVGRMHQAGIVHGDLRPGNVLAGPDRDNRWEFFFLDNERTRKCQHLPKRLRLKNLVQINMLPRGISRTDRLRFFRAYVLANPLVRLHDRQWAKVVSSVTRRRLQEKGSI